MKKLHIPLASGDEPVHYAVTDDGIMVRAIDVTHPAFRVDLSEDQLAALMEKAVTSVRELSSLPQHERHAHM